MSTLLVVHEIHKRFGRLKVLKGATMAVRSGELVGVVGENGSGKTTLLRVLVGRVSHDAGTFALNGRLGWCPQEPLVFPQLTIRENLRYFARAYGLPDWRAPSDALLHRYRFEQHADRIASEVSGGTRQKLNLALALLRDPRLLLLDEPYAGFDWETYQAFWAHADALRADGRGVLVVSHLLHDRHRFDRVYKLADGVLRCG